MSARQRAIRRAEREKRGTQKPRVPGPRGPHGESLAGVKASATTRQVSSIVDDHAQRSSVQPVEMAITASHLEMFPLHLSVEDFDAIAKKRKLKQVEKIVLYVLGFINSNDSQRQAVGLRLWMQMSSKNLSLQQMQKRLQPKTVVPENCRPEFQQPQQIPQPVATVAEEPHQPVRKYRFVLPDNGRGPNRKAEQ